jgi:hypothetical protein
MAVDPTKLDAGARVRFGDYLRRQFPNLPAGGVVVHKPRADAVSVRPDGFAGTRYFNAELLESEDPTQDSRGAA